MDELREQLAALAHEQWSGWVRYMLSKGTYNEDGSWTMPTWAVFRWERQMNTPYAELNEAEQNSDRAEADKFLAVFKQEGRYESNQRRAETTRVDDEGNLH